MENDSVGKTLTLQQQLYDADVRYEVISTQTTASKQLLNLDFLFSCHSQSLAVFLCLQVPFKVE